MRCLLFKKTLSNQYIFIRIEMLFISDFNVLILCKFWAYFALNLFCGATCPIKKGGQISAELSVTVASFRDGNFVIQILLTRTVFNDI